jgi:hypothetical protein
MSELIFCEEKHEYFHDGQKMLNVTSVLEAVGITDFSKVNKDDLEASQRFGKNFHIASNLDDWGELDEKSLSIPLRPYLAAWQKFKRDYNVKIIANEMMVHSHIYQFCGTLDRVLEINGLLVLIDLKSGNMYPSTALQTAAYVKAYEEMTGKKISYRRGIQLKENGNYKPVPYKQKTDWMYFLSALKVCQFRKENNLL